MQIVGPYQILFFGVVFLLCFNSAFSIKCFQCNSAKDPGCDTLLSNDTNSPYYKECDLIFGRNPILCRKTVNQILFKDNLVRTVRACGFEIYKKNDSNCYKLDSDFKYEKSCQCFTDGCNGASTLSASKIIYVSVLAILVYVMYR